MADNGKNDGPKLSPTQNIIILGGGFLLTAIVSMSFDLELSGITAFLLWMLCSFVVAIVVIAIQALKEASPAVTMEQYKKRTAILTIICAGYLAVLIPGDIPINGFTMLIGIICAGHLIYKLFKWLWNF